MTSQKKFTTPEKMKEPVPIVDYDDCSDAEGELVRDFKSQTALDVERGANMRALRLMDDAIAGEAHKPTHPQPLRTGAKTARKAAIEKYEMEKEERHKIQAMLKEVKKHEKESQPKKLVRDKKMEKMATTTRKIKLKPEDVRDPETVAGMKCELEIEREKHAEEKALKLVESHDYGIV